MKLETHANAITLQELTPLAASVQSSREALVSGKYDLLASCLVYTTWFPPAWI
jgi:hypothetical protein